VFSGEPKRIPYEQKRRGRTQRNHYDQPGHPRPSAPFRHGENP